MRESENPPLCKDLFLPYLPGIDAAETKEQNLSSSLGDLELKLPTWSSSSSSSPSFWLCPGSPQA